MTACHDCGGEFTPPNPVAYYGYCPACLSTRVVDEFVAINEAGRMQFVGATDRGERHTMHLGRIWWPRNVWADRIRVVRGPGEIILMGSPVSQTIRVSSWYRSNWGDIRAAIRFRMPNIDGQPRGWYGTYYESSGCINARVYKDQRRYP